MLPTLRHESNPTSTLSIKEVQKRLEDQIIKLKDFINQAPIQ